MPKGQQKYPRSHWRSFIALKSSYSCILCLQISLDIWRPSRSTYGIIGYYRLTMFLETEGEASILRTFWSHQSNISKEREKYTVIIDQPSNFFYLIPQHPASWHHYIPLFLELAIMNRSSSHLSSHVQLTKVIHQNKNMKVHLCRNTKKEWGFYLLQLPIIQSITQYQISNLARLTRLNFKGQS